MKTLVMTITISLAFLFNSGCLAIAPAMILVAASADVNLDKARRDCERGAWYKPSKTREEAIADANDCWAIAKDTVKKEKASDYKDAEEIRYFEQAMKWTKKYRKIAEDDIPPDAKIEKVGYAKVMYK